MWLASKPAAFAFLVQMTWYSFEGKWTEDTHYHDSREGLGTSPSREIVRHVKDFATAPWLQEPPDETAVCQ